MRKARKEELGAAVNLIAATFADNPALDWMIRSGGDRTRRLRHFAAYAVRYAWIRDGVWLSENGKAVALAFRSDSGRFDFLALFLWLRLGITTLRLNRVPALLKREKYRKSVRPSHPYFYIWFMGALPDSRRAAFEFKSGLLDVAAREGLDVYLETSVPRNKTVFERVGFRTYHHWKSPEGDLEFWFMRWLVVSG
ncbi:MAG: hypothetical protein RL213_145 [Bacteroidota bacterium]|jgi:hypothetical protein